MMQAGKDYITKVEMEDESPRTRHLRELLMSVKAQGEPAGTEETIEAEADTVKSGNQEKPTLKLKK